MPVKRRLVKAREQLSAGQRAFLAGISWPADGAFEHIVDPAERFVSDMHLCWLSGPGDPDTDCPDGSASPCSLWREFGDQALREWIVDHPGRRPDAWWRCSAPEPLRPRLGGIGEPWGLHQVGLGVPLIWNCGHHRDLWANPPTPPDPAFPPLFESQAAYLKRHGLMRPDEVERLTPADFEPESILDMIDFEP